MVLLEFFFVSSKLFSGTHPNPALPSLRMHRVVVSPYFGNLSTKHGYRSVLMVASSIIAVGALAYALAWNRASLIMAQVVMGVGSGTLGVTRAYVADKSTPEQRTYLLAYTT